MKKSRAPKTPGVSASLRESKKEHGSPALVPKLRFPEFREADGWDVEFLGGICQPQQWTTISSTDLVDEGYPVYGANGFIGYYTEFNHELETVAVTCRGSTCGEVLLIPPKSYITGNSMCLDGIDAVQNSYHFVYHLLKHRGFDDVISGSAQPQIVGNAIKRVTIALPTKPEQQKIAECLSSVDELMAAQTRKVDALKTHKKGLMQQLFPREGETQPRLRFPEFENAGEWEMKRLDELVDIQSGATPSKANPAFWNGSVPWVSAKDMKRLFLDDAEDHISVAAVDDGARLVPPGTLLMLTRGMTLLKDVPICVLRCEMSFNQDVKGLRPKDGVEGLFLAWMLLGNKPRLLAMVNIAGHGTGKLDTEELKDLELMLPPPAEQQRIADCLTSLDALITAETQKLEALKTHKKALMQQLLPAGEGERRPAAT